MMCLLLIIISLLQNYTKLLSRSVLWFRNLAEKILGNRNLHSLPKWYNKQNYLFVFSGPFIWQCCILEILIFSWSEILMQLHKWRSKHEYRTHLLALLHGTGIEAILVMLLNSIALQIGLTRHEAVGKALLSTLAVESNLEPLERETNFIQPGACSRWSVVY